MRDDKIKKFPLSKEAKNRLALRKKEQKKLFDEILKDTEAGKIEKQLDKVSPKFKKQLEKELLALRKRGKKYRMSFEPSYASKEEYEQEQKRQERHKRRQEASDIRRKEQSTPKQRLAEKKSKEELKKGKVDITGEKGGKEISQYVAEQRNKKDKKKKIKSLLKKGVKVGGAFFTTLLTPKYPK